MGLINNKNWQHSRILKSLLLIIGLQLVVLQVKALTMPVSMNHVPCSEMVMSHHEHSHKTDSIIEDEVQATSCSHCKDVNLDCHNSCYTAGLFTLSFDISLDLINQRNSLSPANLKTFIAVSQQPSIRPPRLLIV